MRESLSDRIFHTLEEEILSGLRRPGDALTELALCSQYAVSRTPVREALARLEQQGLAATLPNRSVVVAGVSVPDMLDIYEMRLRIEGLAASRCALHMPQEAVRQLQSTLDLQEFYAGRGQAEKLRALDSEFHRLIYEGCGSPSMTAVLVSLHGKLRHFRQTSLADAGRAAASLAEHRAILEAIAAHDAAGAEQAMQLHIHHARQQAAALVQEEQI